MGDAPNQEETPVEETEENPTPEADEAKEESTEEPEEGAEESSEEPKTFDEKYVKGLRDEAASYRTKLREAEDKLKNVEDLDEVKAIVAKLTEEREVSDRKAAAEARSLLAENVALTAGLPKALAKKLSGETREELEADAQELAELLGTRADEDAELEGGLSPRDRDSDPDDPRALAKKYGKRR